MRIFYWGSCGNRDCGRVAVVSDENYQEAMKCGHGERTWSMDDEALLQNHLALQREEERVK